MASSKTLTDAELDRQQTTTNYTQVSIRKLHENCAAAHSGSKLERQGGGGDAEQAEPAPTEAELMAALDSEAREEGDDAT